MPLSASPQSEGRLANITSNGAAETNAVWCAISGLTRTSSSNVVPRRSLSPEGP